jgi:pimeloyl-ACP methyl ester carboxylesterase
MMEFKDIWINNFGTTLHLIDSNPINSQLPLVIIPGLSESAEDYIQVMELLSPRRCIAITLRGRGKSDAPQSGYTLEDHISDIEAVISHLKMNEFFLMGFSRGVSYTLGYALKNVGLAKGLVLGDYPAIHSQLPPGWVESFSSLPPWRGKSLPERMKTHALSGLQKDSKEVLFWDKLSTLSCPVLVIRGGKPGSALSEEDGSRYFKKIPKSNLVVFEESGHNLFEPRLENFVDTMKEFFKTVEG